VYTVCASAYVIITYVRLVIFLLYVYNFFFLSNCPVVGHLSVHDSRRGGGGGVGSGGGWGGCSGIRAAVKRPGAYTAHWRTSGSLLPTPDTRVFRRIAGILADGPSGRNGCWNAREPEQNRTDGPHGSRGLYTLSSSTTTGITWPGERSDDEKKKRNNGRTVTGERKKKLM